MMSEKARVRRGGKEMDVPAEDLVVGDLVMIESGVRIPADLRIIQSDSLKVRRKGRKEGRKEIGQIGRSVGQGRGIVWRTYLPGAH